jgi:signal transduction histidine kinase
MVFGGKSGFTIFHPDSLHDNPYIPPVYVTDFKILNKPVQLDTTISEKKHITLSHHQNVFSFEFAALNYIHPEKNQYQYKIEGFDPDWIGAGKRNYASYSNLSRGDYVFHVKASNNDGVWNNEGAAIRITITPPWWRTNVAYIFYVMMFISLIYGFYRFNMYRAGMKNELNMQRFEAKKMREIDEMKSNFFANISHEFRTPLTLILGPLDDFLSKSGNGEHKHIYMMMRRNAQRLMQLINQLLDLSKIETGSATLELKTMNVTEFVKVQVNSFLSWAERKEIVMKLITPENDIIIDMF